MSTRGFVGFKHNKKAPKGWYNHSDSYPSYLGDSVVTKAMTHTRDELLAFFNSVKFLNDETLYDNHKSIFDFEVWDCLSEWQIMDGGTFYKDGLFCEWSYIFNFDNDTLEIYKGFGVKPTKGLEKWFYTDGKDKWYVNRVSVTPLSAFHFDKAGFINSLEKVEND